jgi:HK97 gp10 family phage protein
VEATIKLTGFAELAAQLKALPDNIGRNGLRAAVAAGAAEVRKQAKTNALAMRDTGTLARSIYQKQIREQSSLQRQVFYVGVRAGRKFKKYGKSGMSKSSEEGAFYGRFVEFGHFTRPRGGGRITRGAGRAAVISSSAVHWVPARPFLRPAFDGKKSEAIDAMAVKLRERIERFKATGK